MAFPESSRIELPILQELDATGGSDQLRYLYDRLVRYFPQLTTDDLNVKSASGRSRWHALVQRAGRQLIDDGALKREASRWLLTAKGKRRIEAEDMRTITTTPVAEQAPRKISHKEAQR